MLGLPKENFILTLRSIICFLSHVTICLVDKRMLLSNIGSSCLMIICIAGNIIDATSGRWLGNLSGLGAGLDSFYEYLLKSYIMFGETEDYQMFSSIYKSINEHMRRGYV